MANERLIFLACNIYSILAEYSLHSCTFRWALWLMCLWFCDTTVLSRPKLTFCPLAFLHQILNHSADIYAAILANVSDLSNVCNKTSMSLTNFYRSLYYEGTQIHCGYFLMSSTEKDYERWRYIFAVDVTIYQTYIDKMFTQRYWVSWWNTTVTPIV